MPEERPPALIQLCLRVLPGEGPNKKIKHSDDLRLRKQQQQQQSNTCLENQAPEPGQVFKCYLLHIACLGEAKCRAHPALKKLLIHPKVVIHCLGNWALFARVLPLPIKSVEC